MSVRIMTDSASDISQEKAQEMGVKVIPLKIRFGHEEYLDGVTLSPHEFYEKLAEAPELPKTSQIPPHEYEELFREALDAGDEVVMIALSSGVSGSYQSANIAASEFESGVYVVDSKQFCISQYILVQQAAVLRDAGKSASEIAWEINSLKERARVIAAFDTLEYLHKGGRLSKAAALAGNVLSIKPVLTIDDGKVSVLSRARGAKRANKAMISEIVDRGGIDFSLPVCLGYAGLDDELLKGFIKDSKALYAGKENEIPIADVGATIGTYSGPGAIAIGFFENR